MPGFGTRRAVDQNDFLFIHGSDGSCGLELYSSRSVGRRKTVHRMGVDVFIETTTRAPTGVKFPQRVVRGVSQEYLQHFIELQWKLVNLNYSPGVGDLWH